MERGRGEYVRLVHGSPPFSSVDKGRVGDALDVGVGEESALDC